MKKFAYGLLLVMLLNVTAFAQNAQTSRDKDALPNNFLRGKQIKYSHPFQGGSHAAKKMPNAASLSPNATSSTPCQPQSTRLACVDTISSFNNTFKEQGVYFDGTSRDIWQFSIVGQPPHSNIS